MINVELKSVFAVLLGNTILFTLFHIIRKKIEIDEENGDHNEHVNEENGDHNEHEVMKEERSS